MVVNVVKGTKNKEIIKVQVPEKDISAHVNASPIVFGKANTQANAALLAAAALSNEADRLQISADTQAQPVLLSLRNPRCSNLKNTDLLSTSDPYLKMSIVDKDKAVLSTQQTKYKDGDLNPVWKDDHFDFTVNAAHLMPENQACFKVQVWDKNTFGDKLMGSCSIPLAELVGGVSSVPLEDAKGNTKGMGMFGYEMALDGDSTSAGLAVEDGWSLHHGRIGHQAPSSKFGLGIAGGSHSMGLLCQKDGNGWKAPTLKDELVGKAKAFADATPECTAFAVNMQEGVQFYTNDCFDKAGKLDVHRDWDTYTHPGQVQRQAARRQATTRWKQACTKQRIGVRMMQAMKEAHVQKSKIQALATETVQDVPMSGRLNINMATIGAEEARAAEISRLASVKAAEEASRLQAEEAAKRHKAAEVARIAAQTASEEVTKAERRKRKGHAQWGVTQDRVLMGAKMAYCAKAALAVKCTQEATRAREAALLAAAEEERMKVKAKQRLAQQELEAAEALEQARIAAEAANRHASVKITTVEASPSPSTSPMKMGISVQVATVNDNQEQVLEDGTIIRTAVDGTIVQINPDGVVITQYVDGSIVQVNVDGTEITTQPDGTTIQIAKDGTQIFSLPDGVQIVQQPDGTKIQTDSTTNIQIVTHLDGVTVQTNADGSQITTQLDGTKFQVHPDGSSVTIQLDGTQQHTRVDGSRYIVQPDGSVEDDQHGGSTSLVTTTCSGLQQSLMMFEGNNSQIDITDEDGSLGDEFTVQDLSASNGTVVLVPGATAQGCRLQYTPAVGFTGVAVLKYTIVTAEQHFDKTLEMHVAKSVESDEWRLSEVGDMDASEEGSIGLWRVSC